MRVFIVMMAVAFMGMACGVDENSDGPMMMMDKPAPEEAYTYPVSGTVGGHIDSFENINDDAYDVFFSENSWQSRTDLFVQPNADTVIMARLYFHNGLSVFDLPVGTNVYLEGGEVIGIGCVGPQKNFWQYDNSADVTTLIVTDVPGARLVDYAFEFQDLNGSPTDFLSGSIAYRN